MRNFLLSTIPVALLASQPVCAQEIVTIPIEPPAATTPPATAPGVLPKSVEVRFVLLDSLSSATAKKGQTVHFVVAQDVKVGEVIVIPRGTPAEGTVTHVRKGIPGKQDGSLQIEPRQIPLNDGSRLKLSRNRPGEDDCGDMGPCWGLATFVVVLSPALVAIAVIESPWIIHNWIKGSRRSPLTKAQVAGKNATLSPCGFNYSFTASPWGPAKDAATPHPVADAAALEKLANCPAR